MKQRISIALGAVIALSLVPALAAADQFAVARCDVMRKARGLLGQHREFYSFCKPCGDTAAKRVAVSGPHVDPESGASYENCSLRNGGRQIDLAYVYINRNGALENLAFLAGLAPGGVPRFIAVADRTVPGSGETKPSEKPANKPADVPSDASYLSGVEREVVDELNRARTDPAGYAVHLEGMLRYFRGSRYEKPGQITLMTNEGAAAVQEAIDFLKRTKAIGPLTPSKGMSLAARDHVNDTGPQGITGHQGTDGSSSSGRLNRYGKWIRTCGENISYGSSAARDIVIQLLVDDGVPSRGHRKNIFNPSFTRVGVAIGKHRTYRYMCVNTYAGEYQEK